MKIFISWSGDLSKEIAKIFRGWLPSVIQAVKPFFSRDDVAKGAMWNDEIRKELDQSKIGIICLTRDNIDKPWIMFEAGAISMNLCKAKVCPLLFGLKSTDMQGPLAQFQLAEFSKIEMRNVVKTINCELGQDALDTEVLDKVFEKWWPDLESKVQELSNISQNDNAEIREDRDVINEILKLCRDISVKSRLEEASKLTLNSFNILFIEKYYSIITKMSEELLFNQKPNSTLLIEYLDSLEMLMGRIEFGTPNPFVISEMRETYNRIKLKAINRS